MTIARDASSPAVASVLSALTGTNIAVSASFTPPLGAVLVCKVSTDNSSASTPVYSVSNTTGSGGISGWVQAGAQHNSSSGGSAFIYVTAVTSSTAMVVTATATGGAGVAPGPIYGRMFIEVWTGADPVQTGAAVTFNTSATQTINPSVTTTRAGSQITGVFCDDNGVGTPTSTDTTTGEGGFLETTGMSSLGCYKSANSGASGSTVTLNANAGAAGPGWSYVVLEVLAPSGVTDALTGQSITSSEGTVSRAASYAITGQTVTSSEGSVGQAVTYGLTGQTSTLSEGTITASTGGNVNKSLTGQSITSSEGTISLAVSYSLSDGVTMLGQSITSSEGAPSESITYGLGSQTATFTEGVIGVTAGSNVTKSLTSQTALFTEGIISPSAGAIFALTGQTISSSGGTIGRGISYSSISQTATFAEGVLTKSQSGPITIALGSLTATFHEGVITVSGADGMSMPNLIGLNYYESLLQLQTLGIYIPQSVLAFSPSTITVTWQRSNSGAELVVSQSPAPGFAAKPNQPVTLTIAQFPFGSVIDSPPDWSQVN